MIFIGTIKEGKINLPENIKLPEGTPVRVEILPEEGPWIKQWKALAEEITEAWESPKSALEILNECRR